MIIAPYTRFVTKPYFCSFLTRFLFYLGIFFMEPALNQFRVLHGYSVTLHYYIDIFVEIPLNLGVLWRYTRYSITTAVLGIPAALVAAYAGFTLGHQRLLDLINEVIGR